MTITFSTVAAYGTARKKICIKREWKCTLQTVCWLRTQPTHSHANGLQWWDETDKRQRNASDNCTIYQAPPLHGATNQAPPSRMRSDTNKANTKDTLASVRVWARPWVGCGYMQRGRRMERRAAAFSAARKIVIIILWHFFKCLIDSSFRSKFLLPFGNLLPELGPPNGWDAVVVCFCCYCYLF